MENYFKFIGFVFLIILLNNSIILAYNVDEGEEVHQYISWQAGEVWTDIPDEVGL